MAARSSNSHPAPHVGTGLASLGLASLENRGPPFSTWSVSPDRPCHPTRMRGKSADASVKLGRKYHAEVQRKGRLVAAFSCRSEV